MTTYLMKRKSMRLKDHDYSQPGYYFITICTNAKACYFGEINNDQVEFNEAGEMIKQQWIAIPKRFSCLAMDRFVVMPNHLHGIIGIENPGEHKVRPYNQKEEIVSIGDVIKAFKSLTTTLYIKNVRLKKWRSFERKLWQRNYYEHVIRNGADLEEVRKYIELNPLKWALDKENPENNNTGRTQGSPLQRNRIV